MFQYVGKHLALSVKAQPSPCRVIARGERRADEEEKKKKDLPPPLLLLPPPPPSDGYPLHGFSTKFRTLAPLQPSQEQKKTKLA
ncbi:hypothetical protein Q5P01_003587 [Channa striata]|uniref:Uncharacterized protein n=1 Tax=Channa striata TaxID=64152 RepID=A0AA88NHZ0_CHASR|nr:hypothetical protein Q5P01_003587 [Channa striata]